MEEAVSPTPDEFRSACRVHFGFLVDQYGFRESPAFALDATNPFEVHFEKAGWRIVIAGYSYGFSAATHICAPDGRRAYFGLMVPQDFRERRDEFRRGQLGCIEFEALCVKTFGQRFLSGDWREFDELVRRQSALSGEIQQGQERAHEQAKLARAVVAADEAFRTRRFKDVVAELAPVEALLSPAQKKKLQLAQRYESRWWRFWQ